MGANSLMGFSIDPLSLILGAALGAVVVWLALRNSGGKAAAQAKAVLEQEHALLSERLAAEFRKLSTDALG